MPDHGHTGVLGTTAAPAAGATAGAASAIAAHVGRHLRTSRRDSAVITNALAVPALMFLVLRWLFGDLMAAGQGLAELDLLPLTVALALASQLMNGTAGAAHIIRERQRGLTARVATTPHGVGPAIAGRWVFDTLRALASGVAVLATATLSGLRFHTWAGFGWVLLVILLGAAASASLAAFVGAAGATPESAMGPTPIIMALMTLNGGMVPVERFVGAVQPIARWNPLTFAAQAATRIDGTPAAGILGDGGAGGPAWAFLAWMLPVCAALLLGTRVVRRPAVMT